MQCGLITGRSQARAMSCPLFPDRRDAPTHDEYSLIRKHTLLPCSAGWPALDFSKLLVREGRPHGWRDAPSRATAATAGSRTEIDDRATESQA